MPAIFISYLPYQGDNPTRPGYEVIFFFSPVETLFLLVLVSLSLSFFSELFFPVNILVFPPLFFFAFRFSMTVHRVAKLGENESDHRVRYRVSLFI